MMSAKLTFLVIDMKSMSKHVPKVGDKHYFFNSEVRTNRRKVGLCILQLNSQIGTSSGTF